MSSTSVKILNDSLMLLNKILNENITNNLTSTNASNTTTTTVPINTSPYIHTSTSVITKYKHDNQLSILIFILLIFIIATFASLMYINKKINKLTTKFNRYIITSPINNVISNNDFNGDNTTNINTNTNRRYYNTYDLNNNGESVPPYI